MESFLDNKTGASFISEGFEVENEINKAAIKIKEIEERINNLPSTQHHAYNLAIPGIRRGRNIQTRDAQVKDYKQQIDHIKVQTEIKVNSLIENSSPEIRQKGFQQLDRLVNPQKHGQGKINGYNDKISQSQDKANDAIVKMREKNREKGLPLEKQQASNEKKEIPEMSMSIKYNASLGYTKMKDEKVQKIVKNEIDRGMEI